MPYPGWPLLGAGPNPERLQQPVEVQPDVGGERPAAADAACDGQLRFGGLAVRHRPASFDAVTAIEHAADHRGRGHPLAHPDRGPDVLGQVDLQAAGRARGELVGNPAAARPAVVVGGGVRDDRLADRHRPDQSRRNPRPCPLAPARGRRRRAAGCGTPEGRRSLLAPRLRAPGTHGEIGLARRARARRRGSQVKGHMPAAPGRALPPGPPARARSGPAGNCGVR